MFANPTQVGISQRVVATLVACAMVLWSIGVYTTAQAADLPNISNTLTDSNPGSVSGHLFSFDIPTGSSLGTGDTVTVTFPSTPDVFDLGVLGSGDLTVRVNAGAPVAIGAFASTSGSFSFNNVAAVADDTVTIEVADTIISNPATVASYEFTISTPADSGKTRVAIVDNVLVTAIVNTQFDFTITGLATSTAVNGTSTTGSTTPTEINFGVLSAGAQYNLAQVLSVTTNARNGYVVTVESDGDLASGNGAIIDSFQDGSDVAETNVTWTSPSNNITDDTTWGHWGLTSDDPDLNSLGGFYASEFAAEEFIAASTTPREVFHHDGPSDGITTGIGTTSVLYRVEITPLQEAADDYNTTLTYIATPTF